MMTVQEAIRVLLVDDDKAITQALKAGLESRGYWVRTFNDPMSALAGFTPGAYDVAVLDVRMQPMDGLELHRRLRGLDPKLPVCFLTAYADSIKDRPKGLEFLQKPISLGNLAGRLRHMK